jgi:hypothetical protein
MGSDAAGSPDSIVSSPTDESLAGSDGEENVKRLGEDAKAALSIPSHSKALGVVGVAANPTQPEFQLPDVVHNMVPLRDVIDRMIQLAYAELQNMVET